MIMKKALVFIALSIIFVSCSKYPEPDYWCIGCPSPYTNYCILEEISGKIKKDTIVHKDYYIEVSFLGNIVAENTFFTEAYDCTKSPDPYCTSPYEQKYYLNKIKKIEISADKPYRNQTQEINDVKLFFKDKNHYYSAKSYYDEELGYSPLRVFFTEPPDSSQSFIFKIKITDDNNNIFTCLTDSVYIEK